MKINKNQLKSLIKECLVEIFQENFSPVKNSNALFQQVQNQQVKQNMLQKEAVANNLVRKSNQQNMVTSKQNLPTKKMQNLQNGNAKEVHNDIMKSILEDTQRTTLKNMAKSDYEFNKTSLIEEHSSTTNDFVYNNTNSSKTKKQHINPGDTAEDIVGNNDPKNLFGEEASNKWLKLAFVDKTSNNNYEE